MKIAYSIDFGYVEVDAEVRQEHARRHRRSSAPLGARVEEVDLGWTADVDRDCTALVQHHAFRPPDRLVPRTTHAHLMTDYALKMADAVDEEVRHR